MWLQLGSCSKQSCLQGGQGPWWHLWFSLRGWWQEEGLLRGTQRKQHGDGGRGQDRPRAVGGVRKKVKRKVRGSPAALFTPGRLGAALPSTGHHQAGGATRARDLHCLWAWVAASCRGRGGRGAEWTTYNSNGKAVAMSSAFNRRFHDNSGSLECTSRVERQTKKTLLLDQLCLQYHTSSLFFNQLIN